MIEFSRNDNYSAACFTQTAHWRNPVTIGPNIMDRRRSTRSLATLPTPGTDLAHRAEALAIEALDALVNKLIRKNNNRVPPDFLDWVGTEATQLATSIVKRYMENEAFVARMKSDRAELTVLRVVYRAIMPIVHTQYSELTENLTHYSPLGEFPPSSH